VGQDRDELILGLVGPLGFDSRFALAAEELFAFDLEPAPLGYVGI